VGGGTLNKENPQKTFLNFRNSLMTLYLNLPSGQVIPKIFLRLCLDGIFALKSALGGNVKTIPLIFKAHWAFYAKLSYLRKRRKIYYPNGRPQHLPSKGILHRLIVFRHFLMGVNSFKEIEGHIR
jgi:hypothetical protein